MHRRYIAGAAAVAVLVVLAPRVASAAPLAPSKSSETATIAFSTTGGPCPDGNTSHFAPLFRLNADGTQSPFVIPPKSVFVVTSFDFTLSGATVGRYASANLLAIVSGSPLGGMTALGTAIADPAGQARGSSFVPFGMVVKPPATLCAELANVTSGVVYVHGFFAKDK